MPSRHSHQISDCVFPREVRVTKFTTRSVLFHVLSFSNTNSNTNFLDIRDSEKMWDFFILYTETEL